MSARNWLIGLTGGTIAGIIGIMVSITLILVVVFVVTIVIIGATILFFGVIATFLKLIGNPLGLGNDMFKLLTFTIDVTAMLSIGGVGIFSFLFGILYNVTMGTVATIINLFDSIINALGVYIGVFKQTGVNPYTGLPATNGLPTNVSFPSVDTSGLLSGYQTFVNSIINTLKQLGLVQQIS